MPKIFCYFLFLILFSLKIINLQAQTPINLPQINYTDSLEILLTTNLADSTKLLILKNLCWSYRNINKDKAIDFGKKGLKISQKIRNKKTEADILRFLGIVYWNYLYQHFSLDNYYAALKLSEEINYKEGIGFCYDNLGICFFDKQDYNKALNYALKAKNIFEEIQHKQGLGYAYTHLSQIYLAQKNNELALGYGFKALKIRQFLGNKPAIVNTLRDIGLIYQTQNNYKQSLQYLYQAISLATKSNNAFVLAEAEQCIAVTYLKIGNLEKSLDFATKSFAIAEQYRSNKLIISNAQTLHKINLSQKKYEKALEFNTIYHLYKDSLSNEKEHIKAIEQEAKYEFEKEQKQLKLEVANDALRLQQQYTIIAILILLFIGVIVALVFVFRKKRQQEQMALNLQISNTEITQLAEELQSQTENLEISNEFKDQLFTIIGHDLRSPLIGVNGIFELWQEGILSEEELKEILPSIAKNIYQVTALTENILFWAKSQINEQGVRLETFDLQLFGKNQIDILKTQAAIKQVNLESKIPKNMMVKADKNMIDLVLRNLVGNAIKFCNQNDTIIISLKDKENKNFIEVCVEDTGIGISPENLEIIFIPKLFTLQGTGSKKGTGLGLRLCKDFVERNGGKIWAESEVGKGSKFYFTLMKG